MARGSDALSATQSAAESRIVTRPRRAPAMPGSAHTLSRANQKKIRSPSDALDVVICRKKLATMTER